MHPHPLDWLHFENSFSLVRGRFDERRDGSSNLPMIPAPRWQSELRATFGKDGGRLRNGYLRLELDHSFRQDRPFRGYNTETETPAYTLLHAGLGADIARNGRSLFSLHLLGTNLTDRAYQHHLNRLKYAAINEQTYRRGVYNMGRNFTVRLQVPLVFSEGGR